MNTFFRTWRISILTILAAVLFTGCQTTNDNDRHLVAAPTRESTLRNGDPVTIRLDTGGNAPAQSLDAVIDENGEISLPLVNHIKAGGLTPSELSERIQASYVPRFYVHCTVTVLASIRFFYIGGEIRAPGRFNWTEDVTLMKAVNTAGGFTDFANRRKVEVARGKQKLVFDADDLRQHPEKDPTVQPGDSITVPRSIF